MEVVQSFEGEGRDIIYVPEYLLESFSHLVRNTIQAKRTVSEDTITIKDWHLYLIPAFEFPTELWSNREYMDRDSVPLIISQDREVWRASRCFFNWLVTGNIVIHLDSIVDKDFMLRFARALMAPLFRAALLDVFGRGQG